jgi:hypothetical protein
MYRGVFYLLWGLVSLSLCIRSLGYTHFLRCMQCMRCVLTYISHINLSVFSSAIRVLNTMHIINTNITCVITCILKTLSRFKSIFNQIFNLPFNLLGRVSDGARHHLTFSLIIQILAIFCQFCQFLCGIIFLFYSFIFAPRLFLLFRSVEPLPDCRYVAD